MVRLPSSLPFFFLSELTLIGVFLSLCSFPPRRLKPGLRLLVLEEEVRDEGHVYITVCARLIQFAVSTFASMKAPSEELGELM